MKRMRIRKVRRVLFSACVAVGAIVMSALPAVAAPMGSGPGGEVDTGITTTEAPRVVEVTADAYWIVLALTAAVACAAIAALVAGHFRRRRLA
jgi:hypothetical protein